MVTLIDNLGYSSRIVTPVSRGYVDAYYSGNLVHHLGPQSFSIKEELWSNDHPGYRGMLGKADIGGPFLVMRNTYTDDVSIVDTKGTSNMGVIGSLYPAAYSASYSSTLYPSLGYDPRTALSLTSLVAKGGTAISRCAPTKPRADMAVALAELKSEGFARLPSSAIRSSAHKFKSLGDEYINVEFGWKPFVSDLRKLARSIIQSDDYLKQLARNSGKVVKRSYRFPLSESVSQTVESNKPTAPALLGLFYTKTFGTRYVTTVNSVDSWFDGAFTYYFDLSGTESWDRVTNAATRFRHLYGIKLTPDVIWNLMPWSWFIDWGANVGDVISNVSLFSNDGLVMRYGYIMEHRKVTVNYNLQGVRLYKMSTDLKLSQTFGRESKSRLRASPFGFGLSFDGFSARQLAILSALGISHA